jgi:putative mRNA 3-end processing factor
VRWLTENGLEAQGFKTEYGDEDVADQGDAKPAPADVEAAPDAAP